MADLIYWGLELILGRLKRSEYRIDRSVRPDWLLGIVSRRMTWLLRGFLKCLVLQRRFRVVFMAPMVNLRNASGIRFGRGVTLERGAIIDGLSRDGVEIGDNVTIGAYSIIRSSVLTNLGAGVRMGRGSAMDAYCFIGAAGPISIGENVIMGQHVSFHAENHKSGRTDTPIKLQGTERVGIVVENDCWIGSNTTFLDGAHVETGCVIGAGSIVRGRIPAYSVAVGAPAHVIKSRSPVAVAEG